MGGGMAGAEEIFSCVQCGRCCEGGGGIVLSAKDLKRLAAFLRLSKEDLIKEYGEYSGGKLKIRQGADGFCVFFKGSRCSVHEGKPDICRAWPFFKGNLLDSASFAMAKSFCPGISQSASFEEFSDRGCAALIEEGLIGEGSSQEANALIISRADIVRRRS